MLSGPITRRGPTFGRHRPTRPKWLRWLTTIVPAIVLFAGERICNDRLRQRLPSLYGNLAISLLALRLT